MSGKFMSVKRVIVPTITMLIIASQLMGCSSVSQSEMLQMINQGDQIEIEVAAPVFAESEQGTQSTLSWVELGLLDTNPTMRKDWDDILQIKGSGETKNGVLYVNEDGERDINNTLRVVLHNTMFQNQLKNEKTVQALADAAASNYADIEADETDKALYMGINGYFNLLPDNQPNYSNADSTLQRNEFMAMVYRAESPVHVITADETFTSAVGKSEYNLYAQDVAKDSYLDIESKSLNNMTSNGAMTRAEAVYMIVSRYFADDLKNVDVKTAELTDAKDGGNIAAKQKFIESNKKKDYWKSYELTYALQNPDSGLPSDLYKALVVANNKGLIDETTRWDEAITRSEAVELLVTALQKETGILLFSASNAATTENEVIKDTKVEEDTIDSSMGSEDLEEDAEYKEPEVEEIKEEVNEEASIQIVEELDKTMYATKACNARSGDGTNYDKVTTVEKSASLHVTGRTSNDWYRVTWGNGVVYIKASLLSDTKPTEPTGSSNSGTTNNNSNSNSGSNNGSNSSTTTPSQGSSLTQENVGAILDNLFGEGTGGYGDGPGMKW